MSLSVIFAPAQWSSTWTTSRLAVQHLSDANVRTSFEQKPSHELGSPSSSSVGMHLDYITRLMHLATGFACGLSSHAYQSLGFSKVVSSNGAKWSAVKH